MEVLCGESKIKIADIAYALVIKLPELYLETAERQANGPEPTVEDLDFRLSDIISIATLNKYAKEISWALLRVGPNGDEKTAWRKVCDLKQHIIFTLSDCPLINQYPIFWKYKIDHEKTTDIYANVWDNNEEKLYAKQLAPAIRLLLDLAPKKADNKTKRSLLSGLFDHNPLADIPGAPKIDDQAAHELALIYKALVKATVDENEIKEKARIREEQKRQFMETYKDKMGIIVQYHDKRFRRVFVEGQCGFDIVEKEKEINRAVDEYKNQQAELEKQKAKQEAAQKARAEKVRNSYNKGEADVEYALKWIMAANKDMFIPIVGDCESNHKINCIWLKNPNFVDEPQEIDHILVCPAGVICIETKDWKDRVIIREDGKWIRQTEGDEYGVASPKMQMQRHEALLQSILPNVPIFSLLCFSNSSIVIDGRENFDAYPLLLIEDLDEALKVICSAPIYTAEEVNQIVATIEAHKIGNK